MRVMLTSRREHIKNTGFESLDPAHHPKRLRIQVRPWRDRSCSRYWGIRRHRLQVCSGLKAARVDAERVLHARQKCSSWLLAWIMTGLSQRTSAAPMYAKVTFAYIGAVTPSPAALIGDRLAVPACEVVAIPA